MTGQITVECPHCYTRVLPTKENICPACRKSISATYDVDLDMASLTVYESQELPPYCYRCNSYTERYVKVVGDKGTLLDRSLGVVVSLFVPVQKMEENTSNVFVGLPQCEACAELEEPTPIQVDYEDQSMTFVVNIGFKEKVQSASEQEELPESDESIDEESGGL